VISNEERLAFLSNRDLAGDASAYCARYLYNFVVKNNCKVILELGVRSGVSTRTFLLGCSVTGGHLWSVDISEICVQNIHFGDDWDLSKYWTYTSHTDDLDYEWNRSIDLLFIDTSHTYEQTLAELIKFSPYVKYGGMILLHDSLMDHINGWGVLRAIKTFISSDWYFYEMNVEGGLAVLEKLYPFSWLYGED